MSHIEVDNSREYNGGMTFGKIQSTYHSIKGGSMKKIVFIAVAVLFLSAGLVSAQMEHMMGEAPPQGAEEELCPMGYPPGMMGYGMMGYGMGPGMMGYGMGHGMKGYGMGPGMMGYGMMGCGMGPGMMGYGMMDFDKDEYEKFLDNTRDLRKEMHMKKFDYFEAMRDPEKNKEKIDKIRSEMKDIKKKIIKEMIK